MLASYTINDDDGDDDVNDSLLRHDTLFLHNFHLHFQILLLYVIFHVLLVRFLFARALKKFKKPSKSSGING